MIRNGINDLPQDDKTEFALDSNSKIQWDGTVNGNGAVSFMTKALAITDLDLALYIPRPATRGTPVTSFTAPQYTGTVVWKRLPDHLVGSLFLDGMDYKADVTLRAVADFTFEGMADKFYHSGGDVTNPDSTGGSTITLTITFPATFTNVINIDTLVEGDSGPGWTFSDKLLAIKASGPYTIKGEAMPDAIGRRIKVAPYLMARITLEAGVYLDVSGTEGACAFDMTNAMVTLVLAKGSETTLKSGTERAGIQAPAGSTLLITSEEGGTLSATGGSNGAGIGGGSGGNITIKGSGKLTATTTMDDASAEVNATGRTGIGGGYSGSGGNITIPGRGHRRRPLLELSHRQRRNHLDRR